jgi:3-oxoacyl-[acyl-carrier protein] reductase
MTLEGKRALITGTATGIGREIAFRFASSGAEIVAVDWDEKNNSATAAQINAKGGRCQALTADVSSEADITTVFSAAGGIDILVNNAASVQGDGYLMELSGENWDRVIAICLKSVFLCTREALKGMVPGKAGAIVNLSSANALMGINLAAYTAAKGGIISLTRLTAAHYARHGIRANVICPGTISARVLNSTTRSIPNSARNCGLSIPEASSAKSRMLPRAPCFSHRTMPHSSTER